MNKNDYINKMNKILSNKTQFQKESVDNNIANLTKFQRFLYDLKRNQFLKKDIYDRIRPISALTPTLYGLPKMHKEGFSSRSISASNRRYTYDCAVWLNEIHHCVNIHLASKIFSILFPDCQNSCSVQATWFHLR